MNEIQNLPWQRVVAWAEEELKVLRKRIERLDCSHDETQVARGEIRALKNLLELPQKLAPQQVQTSPLGWSSGGDS